MTRPPEMNRPPEDEFRDLVQELRRTAPEPPPIHWGAYRAELRDKLERRQARTPWAWTWSWKSRPLQIAVAISLVAVLAWVGLPGRQGTDQALLEDAILASRLDLIVQLDVVLRLDVLEDFDVISRLDRLTTNEG
ncbi:MAG TPA: hypothetical protein VNQ15_12560 [Verrucomicrobiae bacterium]|nr:hypothetical protein [Verrucomicrobiae bacterium]